MTAIVTAEQAREWGRALYDARRTGIPIEPFTDAVPELGMEDGYAIQQHLVSAAARRRRDGGRLQAGADVHRRCSSCWEWTQPDFGPVFASGVFRDGVEIPVDRFIAPRIEAEIGVVLSADLAGPHCTPSDALRATAGLVAALEIVDSRIAGTGGSSSPTRWPTSRATAPSR